MVFHENRLLADNSHEISYLNFSKIKKKMSQNLSSAVIVIGALRVKIFQCSAQLQLKVCSIPSFLILNAPITTIVICFFLSAEMFMKPLWQTVLTQIRLPL